MALELDDAMRAAVGAGRLAHVAAIAQDSRPRTTVVWVGMAGDEIHIGRLAPDRKRADVARHDRVAPAIEADGEQIGLQNHLVVEGTAHVTEGGAPALLRRDARRYTGAGARFPPMPDPPRGVIGRDTPTKVHGHGPRDDRP